MIKSIFKYFLFIFSLFACLSFLPNQAEKKVKLTGLECEMLTNPQGIDVLQPRLSWRFKAGDKQVEQQAYQIVVASTKEKLENGKADLWDSGKIESSQSIKIKYQGKTLKSKDEAYWKVRVWMNNGVLDWSKTAFWSMGILNYAEWKSTRWIGMDRAFPWDSVTKFSKLSARYLRKEFNAKKTIKSAKIYLMGVGLYELYINGNKLGDQVLSPVPTDYTKNVKYNVFDVTSALKTGKNTIGTILGNGRYFAMRQDYKPYKIKTFGFPKMALQLAITYNDGTSKIIKTDESWKLTADGPIRSNNEYDGEIYDARKEMPGWNKNNFDDSNWLNATYVQEPRGQIEAQMTPNMKVMEEITPVSIHKLSNDRYVLDMGQNMAGWLNIKVKGKRGDKVTLKFAETLKDNGELYRDNLRDAKATDTYILKGNSEEIWHPTFVYHGFRYVEVAGVSNTPKISDFIGQVVYDDMKTTGSFTSSNAVMNKVYHNAYWGIRSNYKGMPVDCPQRNERQPWLGDRATGAYGESFLFDNETLYAKWLDDIENAQTADGGIPDVAPAFWRYYGDDVTWPGTYFTVADMLYKQYDNKKVIQKHYPSMKKWIKYMETNYLKDGLMTKDKYGDWCVPPESKTLIHSQDPSRQTDGVLLASAYYIHLLKLMQKFAKIADAKNQDIQYYKTVVGKIKNAFNKKFFNRTGAQYSNHTVTANILPLAFHLVPEGFEKKVFKNIENAIEKTYNSHISTGVIGTQFLMRTLSEYGRPDLAYTLASNSTYPSWGYMAKNGATTIWELWNGNTADPSMNSQNHVMLLGDLMIWYYEDMAGIKSAPDFPGFKKIIMKPYFKSGLEEVNASYQSIHGSIQSHWKYKKEKLKWTIVIPPNTSADIFLPSEKIKQFLLNGKKQTLGNSIQKIDNRYVLNLKAGTYTLKVK